MAKDLNGLMRTHNCGELTEKDVGASVSLCGWVNKVRDLGGLYFIDVRDKFGLTQLNFEEFKGNFDFKQLSLESVIRVSGKVAKRPEAAQNKNMGTGFVEVAVTEIEILSKAQIPPFLPNAANQTVTEDLKLKYRYLEIRNQKLQEIIKKRSEVGRATRNVLYELGFIEVDTPILYKTTPEGARDYIVPSRVHPGKVYALPQSPQTLKQLLMIGGTDKYFQLCRCFRDEDLRADRQPEFTQVDIETSFSSSLYMKNLAEKLIKRWFPVSADFTLEAMTFEQAMNDYGSDKPDVRTKSLKQYRMNELFATSDFGPFKTVGNGLIKAMFLKDSDGVLTRKDIDGLVELVKPYQGKAVYWFKLEGDAVSGGMSKFITPEILANLKAKESGNGIWFMFADSDENITHNSADAVRRFLINKFSFNKKEYAFLWVYDFPLLEFDDKSNRFVARHHPFTRPLDEDMPLFLAGDKESLKKCRAEAYDVVCNGYEIGGGSMRIFNQDIQSLMFKALGMTEEETLHQFGFFIEALKYGTPPHGGIAFGFDRLLMLIAKTDNIRDVIAFPKTTSATDLMAAAPSGPNPAQLRELHFNWTKE